MTSSSINFQKNLLRSETKKENPKIYSEKKIKKNGNSPYKMNQKFKPDPFSPIPKRIQPKLIQSVSSFELEDDEPILSTSRRNILLSFASKSRAGLNEY